MYSESNHLKKNQVPLFEHFIQVSSLNKLGLKKKNATNVL